MMTAPRCKGCGELLNALYDGPVTLTPTKRGLHFSLSSIHTWNVLGLGGDAIELSKVEGLRLICPCCKTEYSIEEAEELESYPVLTNNVRIAYDDDPATVESYEHMYNAMQIFEHWILPHVIPHHERLALSGMTENPETLGPMDLATAVNALKLARLVGFDSKCLLTIPKSCYAADVFLKLASMGQIDIRFALQEEEQSDDLVSWADQNEMQVETRTAYMSSGIMNIVSIKFLLPLKHSLL